MELKDLLDESKVKSFQKQLKRKGYKGSLKKVANLAKAHFASIPIIDNLRAGQNVAAKERNIERGKELSLELDKLEIGHKDTEKKLKKLWEAIPNIPFADVPDGGENDGKVIATVGEPPKIINPKDHVELGAALDLIDVERGAKAAGSRFYYLKNQAVELEFALIRYVWDILSQKGFRFLMVPQLLSEKAMSAGGYLGKAKAEVYKTPDDLYLIGTSEQSMLAYHLDEIIDAPKRYTSFSTCFRREAGSYGKDVKGIIRTHQFDKVEMFSFVQPNKSEEEFELLVATVEKIIGDLEIPYRKVLLAAGDMSMASAKTIDFECWLPSQNCYRETHSISNCSDWQARRGNIRYRLDDKTDYVHTLNGTAMAIGRFLAVLLENHQQPDGSIKIPKALQAYTGFNEIKAKDIG